jgi:hypothetical protein
MWWNFTPSGIPQALQTHGSCGDSRPRLSEPSAQLGSSTALPATFVDEHHRDLSFRPPPERQRRQVEEPAFLRHVTDAVKRPLTCHPEAAESPAKRATPNEEPALSLSKDPCNSANGRLRSRRYISDLAQVRADRIRLKRLEFA